EHPAVLVGQRNHLVKPGPGEADAGDIACAVDGIGPAERLLVEPLRPAVRIIVDADRGAASSPVDMVGQREIAKAEVARDVGQRLGERLLRLELADVPDKRVYTTEHPPLRLCR